MPTYTVADVRAFFSSDKLITAMSDARIQYWIDDLNTKNLFETSVWGELLKNGYMNLLGHFLLAYETNTVGYSGQQLASDSTGAVSKSWATNPNLVGYDNEYMLTKYGRIYLSLLRRLAITYGGFVTVGVYI